MVSSDDMIIPINGASTIKDAILIITAPCMEANPLCIMAAPAKPPIRVCEEEEGIPDHQVAKFQIMAATMPEKITGNVMYCS